MILEWVFRILENESINSSLIKKVRYSPENDCIIVDVNFNKVIRICVNTNVIHVQGDLLIANKLKKLIERKIKQCQ